MTAEFKKRIFVHIGLSLGVIALLSVLIFLVKADINKRILKIQELESKIAEHTRAEESLILLKGSVEAARAANDSLRRYVPESDELINFSKVVLGVAREKDVQIAISFGGEARRDDGLKALVFEIRTVSQMANFFDFLDAIERETYLITIQNVAVTRPLNAQNFEGIITGTVFSRSTDAENA